MIRHIVMFKIKDECKAELPVVVAECNAMNGRIEGMLSLEAGADFLHSERSWDLGLACTFDTMEHFEAYANHPVHVPVKQHIMSIACASAACDYEF